jgi:hypothetical protein
MAEISEGIVGGSETISHVAILELSPAVTAAKELSAALACIECRRRNG